MLKTYIRIAYRNLSRNKAYGMLNVIGLALSITCGILIFATISYHLSFDKDHAETDRIYRFVTEQHRDQISYVPSVPPSFGKAFRNDYNFGEYTARIASFPGELITVPSATGEKKFKELTGPSFVETDFFKIFNLPMVRGEVTNALAQPNSVILTERMAKKFFGNEDPINKVVTLNNKTDAKVTGILKDLPVNTDLRSEIYVSWSTLVQHNAWFQSDNSWGGIASALQCFVKLRPNVSPAQVEKVLPAYVKKFRAKMKNVHHYKLQPIKEVHFDGRYGGTMEKKNIWVLSLIGVFLLATACVNFINLATAQALKRSKEVGIKKVLGSMRKSLFWQFISETAIITITATILATILTYPLVPLMNEWFGSRVQLNPLNDARLLLFLVLLIVVVTFFAGSYPAVVLSGFKPIAALKGKLSMQQVGGFNIRRALIVSQFAISLLLIIGLVVITKQMRYAKETDLGFNKDAVVMIPMGVDSTDMQVKTLQNQMANIPGVENVSICSSAPADESNWFNSVRYDTRSEYEAFRVNIKSADHQYIPTFNLKLVAGRNVFASDSVREVVVNEAMLRALGVRSPEEAIGRSVEFDGGDSRGTIVGVLKDFHDQSFHEDINPVLLTTLTDQYSVYAVKLSTNNVSKVLKDLEKTWSTMHPNKLYEYQFLDEHIAEFYETEATMLKLISCFSVVAIFIGCLGLYGLIAFMVAQKTKEIGIRKVLGSGLGKIMWIFGKEFSLLIFIAFLVAAPLGWWMMNSWLQDFEYHIPLGPSVFVIAVVSIMMIAVVTVGYQIIRAGLMNPIKSLRSE